MENEEEYLSLSKAAELLGVTTKTIRNWDDRGKIRTVRTPGNHRRIPISEVTRLLQEERLKPGETLAELQQESEAYMGMASAKSAYPALDELFHGHGLSPEQKKVAITPSEYKAHLKLFGLEDVEALSSEKTELQLTPEMNLGGELNRDELTHFTRLLIHKIEDILNSRLKDDEFITISNIVANIHERANPETAGRTIVPQKARPGKAMGVTPGVNNSGNGLGYLEGQC